MIVSCRIVSCRVVVLCDGMCRVRSLAVAFLQRLDTIKEGNRSIGALNYFLLLTYSRLVREQQQQQAASQPSTTTDAAPTPADRSTDVKSAKPASDGSAVGTASAAGDAALLR